MQRSLLLALGIGLLALQSSCGPKPLASPPPAPAARSAADWIPSDLDVVARLDLGRVRDALGPAALETLANEALAGGNAGRDPGGLLLASLLSAELVFLGFRPGHDLAPLDRVLSVEGRFEQLRRPPAGFSGATDLGGDVRYWERRPAEERLPRVETARIYAFGERTRVFVSTAEIDAVERALSGLGGEGRLVTPEQGTLSVAARPWLLTRLLGGATLDELFRRAKALTLVTDLESDSLLLKLQLELANETDAERLAHAVKEVLARQLAGTPLAASARVEVLEERVTLGAKLSRAELGGAVACWRAPSSSECTW